MTEMKDNQTTNKKFTLFVMALGAFMIPFMGSSINIGLPSIGKEFGMDVIVLSWVTGAYLLVLSAFQIPSGRIADIYGRKKVFMWGFIIYTFFSALCAMSSSAFFFIASRSLQAIGASMTFSTGVAILMSIFPAEERGKVLGISIAAVYLGQSCGPFLGGLLIHYFGWRTIFLINIPLGLLIIYFTLWKLKGEWTEARGEKFDLIGSILYSFTIVTVMYGFSLLPRMWGVFSILLGLTGAWAFVKWETQSESPVLDIGFFRNNKVFAFSSIATMINFSATFAVGFLLSLYLQLVKGLSPHTAGMIMISQPIVQTCFSPFAGRMSDRIEPRIVASIGMALTAVGLSLFIFLDEETTILFVVVSLILVGFGLALFSSPNTNAVMSSIGKKHYGVASGTLGTMRITGNMFSMGIVMLIFSLWIGRVQITASHSPLFIKSLKSIFIIFTVLCLTGIFASLHRGRVR
ncbi:MAG: MFS transporter [Deltaproteobacteria bacterium RBG_16_47_11]|nr:MAG: MFS transporter [Deltaproteobacteria bacterium RBG_16_47_11]